MASLEFGLFCLLRVKKTLQSDCVVLDSDVLIQICFVQCQ